ncbi:hypothetical protein Tco_1171566, partial [Tanacetum coccineum]
ITSSSWPFVSAVLSQMAHLVANITLNSARSCVIQGAFLTQGMVSNKPTILSWSGSISPEGFLSSVLLWLVIIVVVVGVTVVVVVESSSVVKLSFSLKFRGGNIPFNTSRQSPDENLYHFLRIWHHSGTQGCQFLESSHICWAKQFHQDRASSVKVPISPTDPFVPLKLIGWQLMNSLWLHLLATGASLSPVFLLVLSAFSIVTAYASRAVATLSATSFLMAA